MRDQSLRRISAAFLNESIIREVITGRYLRSVSVQFNQESMGSTFGSHDDSAGGSEGKRGEGFRIQGESGRTYVAGRSWSVS